MNILSIYQMFLSILRVAYINIFSRLLYSPRLTIEHELSCTRQTGQRSHVPQIQTSMDAATEQNASTVR